MNHIVFSWDESEARQNLQRHGVSFDEASTSFLDENARLIHDPEHSQHEDRFILLGLSARLRLLLVCHTCRKEEREIQIISARTATRSEQKQYGSYL